MIYGLTLHAPYAFLFFLENHPKQIETRAKNATWKYRGPLAIHVSVDRDSLRKAFSGILGHHIREAFQGYYGTTSIPELERLIPWGHVIGTVDYYDNQATDDLINTVSEREFAFGNYAPGRRGLLTRKPRRLINPVEATGRQGLWPFDETLLGEFHPTP